MNENHKIRLMEFRSTYKWGGGPDKTVLNSARLHDKNKFEVTVVYLRSRNDKEFILGEKGRSMGVDVIEVLEDSPVDLKAFNEVVQILKERRIDILHSRDYKTNFLALLIKHFYIKNLKIVTTTHGWIHQGIKLQVYNLFDKIFTAFFDRTFILYKDQLKDFIVHPSPRRTTIIHNAIDGNDWNDSNVNRGKLRRELNIKDDTPLVGFVGRIMPEKDLFTFVGIANELVNHRKVLCQFVMVGEGKDSNYEQAIVNKINQFGLISYFHFLGTRKDLKEIYRDMDIFLATSVKEGFPNSLLEAMAMKVPSVVSAVGGIPEIIQHRKTGMLCQPKDIHVFTDCIEELIKNVNLREEIITNARHLVENELSFVKRLERVEEVYIQLVNNEK